MCTYTVYAVVFFNEYKLIHYTHTHMFIKIYCMYIFIDIYPSSYRPGTKTCKFIIIFFCWVGLQKSTYQHGHIITCW